MSLLVQLIEKVLADKPSEVVESIMCSLPSDKEEAYAELCDQFRLGEWFYEALVEGNIDLAHELEQIRLSKQLEEDLVRLQVGETERDMRMANGWMH